MKSSGGEHYIALDHIRALAIFLVFSWHFLHTGSGIPVPFDYTPSIFFFSILNEGHTGVSLFMALSGYLFAKLLDGKTINYRAFYWNRFVRLAPLLLFIIVLVGMKTWYIGGSLSEYLYSMCKGVVLPSFPNGGWSITIEFHFYLLLPFLLAFSQKSNKFLLLLLLFMPAFRSLLYAEFGEVRWYSYWTIIGRLDQFLLGILAFKCKNIFYKNHLLAVCCITAFLYLYWMFDSIGGFNLTQTAGNQGLIWIVLPAIEGLAYAALIAYYDNSFKHSNGLLSRFIGLIGTYSYSIYLFHFFFVFRISHFIDQNIISLSNFYLACLFSLLSLFLMLPIGYLSYRFIEAPFLKLRKRYLM